MQNLLKNTFDYKQGKLFWKNINPMCRVRKNGDVAGSLHHTNRFIIHFNNKHHSASRLIWIYHNGDIPKGFFVDHINRNSLDDRIENLRLATASQNCQNRNMPNKIAAGVHYDKINNKYISRITVNKKRILLGIFDTVDEASNCYKIAKNKFHKQFSIYNNAQTSTK